MAKVKPNIEIREINFTSEPVLDPAKKRQANHH
jgi:hypothetical protein